MGRGLPSSSYFPNARPDHESQDERERSTLEMNDGRTRVVDRAMAQAAVDAEAGEPAPAPHPAAIGAVDECADADAENCKALKAPSLGERAGGDGGGGVHEDHHVEKEHQHAGRDRLPAEEKPAEPADSPMFCGDGEIEHVTERRSAVKFKRSRPADQRRGRSGRTHR